MLRHVAVRIPAFANIKPVTASFGDATYYAGDHAIVIVSTRRVDDLVRSLGCEGILVGRLARSGKCHGNSVVSCPRPPVTWCQWSSARSR